MILISQDIYKQSRDDGVVSPAELPYFEGDFWPNVIEDCIREAASEEATRKKDEPDDYDDDDDIFQVRDYHLNLAPDSGFECF